MTRGELVYEGKAKQLYTTEDPDLLIQWFKDDATAFNAKKRGTIVDKGVLNNRMSEIFFRLLAENGVPNHFVSRPSDREMIVKRVDIIPIETVVRNVIAGSLAKRFGKEEGGDLPRPIIEFFYKSDALDDPMINDDHAIVFGLATEDELATIRKMTLRTNEILEKFLDERGILLVDAKFEFGRYKGQILLADEICPDTCRYWDKQTREKLDKDRFRRDLGGVEEAYREVAARIGQ